MVLSKVSSIVFSICMLAELVVLAGCGSGSKVTIPIPPIGPTSVIFSATPPKSLAVKASATLAASAIYASASNSGSTSVTWSVSCGTAGACGTFSASDEGGAIVYTAPSTIPSGSSVTVTATSVADTTKSASTTITIVAPIPISVSFFATPPASLQIGATFSFSAGINNDVSANPQVKWSVTCGGASCGTFNPTTTDNEQQTTYTAPTTIPSGGSVTLTITSVTDPTKSASVSVLITAAAPTLADGTYVFQVSGVPGNNASFITGAFTAKGGAITGGEQDSVIYSSDSDNNSYAYASSQQITGGSYTTTADGNLAVSLQAGPGATEVISGSLNSAGKGFVANLDGSPASGTMDLQTSTAAPSGGYAISLSGGDAFSDAAWIGGILNFDSAGKISGAGSILDVIDSFSTYTGPQTIGASAVTAPDANGRFQFQLTTGTKSTLPAIYLIGYMIDATHIRLIETGDQQDSTNFQGVLGGTALGQGASTGTFTTAPTATYVFGGQGSDTQGGFQIAGTLTPKSDGTISGVLTSNDLSGNTPSTPTAFSGTYTLDPTGRMTVSKLMNTSGGSSFSYSLYLYLTGDGNALLLSNDSDDIFAGQAYQQQAAAFTTASFSGNYGLNATEYTTAYGGVGLEPMSATGPLTVTADASTNTVTGFADNGASQADFAIAGSFTSASDGVFQGNLAGFNPQSRSTSGSFTLYLVDSTQGILIETDNTQLTLGRVVSIVQVQ